MSETVESIVLTPVEQKTVPRRARFYDIMSDPTITAAAVEDYELAIWEKIDLIYRTLCGIMFNFVPTSGHPGGSISSGRIVEGLMYQTMEYDITNPDRPENDFMSYAAGHKAMGLYAAWALRNELVRAGKPELLPDNLAWQLRLEDLLGFRRNPTNETPLFNKYHSKALDGHPTCLMPGIKHATGPSGFGVPAGFGLAAAALDIYRDDPPRVHMIEGEGGMTAGRVHEALASAATNGLRNIILHVDFNQASIDSDHVCLDETGPGQYVQWNPGELTYFHDWNTINVPDGKDFRQVLAAQRAALTMDNGQPTAVIYRTIKGWKYGIEGCKSHGAGHKFASPQYYEYLSEFEQGFGVTLPRFEGDKTPTNIEQCYFDTLMGLRSVIENNSDVAEFAASRVAAAKENVIARKRKRHANAPNLDLLYTDKSLSPDKPPEKLQLKPGDSITLRAAFGEAAGAINRHLGGAILAAAADLAGSTSINKAAAGFPEGFYHSQNNPDSRLMALGGICEDCIGSFMAGVSAFGQHIGASSSYGAFIAALEHIAARVHCIGQQTRRDKTGEPFNTWIMLCAHAGAKTGEDGPTHADPQPLQLLQECFPKGLLITLTPWDAREMWPLVLTALRQRPAVLAPFVTRPADTLVDWKAAGLPSVMETVNGVYAMHKADPTAKQYNGTLVLQGNAVATIFVNEVLPRLDEAGYNLNVYYISSVELFNALDPARQEEIFPNKLTYDSMGITDFTLPIMYRWVRSPEGLAATLYPFREGHFLGSGNAAKVLQEAGIHAEGQWQAISKYAQEFEKRGK
jgi:transketolase